MGTETTKYKIVLEDKLTPELKKSLREANAFEDSMDGINKKSKSAGASLKSAFGGLAIAAGVAFIGKEILTLGINMEQTRVSFETFLGSKSAANKVIDELNEFSNVTPFTNDQVISAGKQLLAFGLEAEKLKPTLRAIGDISAGTGKDFNELSSIYGKAMTSGIIQGEELNQLSEAGIPIIKEFAKMFGVQETAIKKMGSEGKITFADLETAFSNMSGEGGMFFNLMEKQSKTLGGKLSTLVGKLQLIGASIGEDMTGGLGKFIDILIDFADNNAENIIRQVGQIAEAFGSIVTGINDVYQAFTGDGKGNLLGDFFDTFVLGLRGTVALVNVLIKGIGGLALALKGIAYIGAFKGKEGNEFIKEGMALTQSGFDDFGNFVNQLRIEGAGSSRAGYRDGPEDDGTDGLGEAAGLGGGSSPTGDGTNTSKKVSGNIAGVQSKIKNINITIDKMVENINFNNITSKQSESELVEMISRALLTAVNDVNVIAR